MGLPACTVTVDLYRRSSLLGSDSRRLGRLSPARTIRCRRGDRRGQQAPSVGRGRPPPVRALAGPRHRRCDRRTDQPRDLSDEGSRRAGVGEGGLRPEHVARGCGRTPAPRCSRTTPANGSPPAWVAEANHFGRGCGSSTRASSACTSCPSSARSRSADCGRRPSGRGTPTLVRERPWRQHRRQVLPAPSSDPEHRGGGRPRGGEPLHDHRRRCGARGRASAADGRPGLRARRRRGRPRTERSSSSPPSAGCAEVSCSGSVASTSMSTPAASWSTSNGSSSRTGRTSSVRRSRRRAGGWWHCRRRPSEPLVDHLARFVDPEPWAWVFTGDKGGPLREAVWQQEWVRARRTVGLPDLHFHDLRHLAATLAASTGAGVKEIMYRIGHSSPQAALRYQHASQQRDRSIAEGISRPRPGTSSRWRSSKVPAPELSDTACGARLGLRRGHGLWFARSGHGRRPTDQHERRERVTGIEPAFSAWEADVLPLNYTRGWARHPSPRGRTGLSRAGGRWPCP